MSILLPYLFWAGDPLPGSSSDSTSSTDSSQSSLSSDSSTDSTLSTLSTLTSDSSDSSSSSAPLVTWWSQLYNPMLERSRTDDTKYKWSVSLDLSYPDQIYLDRYHDPYIELGGAFNGVVIPNQEGTIEDNGCFVVIAETDDEVGVREAFTQWHATITQRTFGKLMQMRDAGEVLNLSTDEYRVL